MPPNQKHTQAFTYEPLRIAQECITSEQEDGRARKPAVVGHSAVAISFHFTCRCPVGRG